MNGLLLIISMPFKVGVGGFLRSYFILPKLTRLLRENGYEVELYIPANALRTFIKFHLRTRRDEQVSCKHDCLLDELFDSALNEINKLEKQSKYAFAVNETLFKKSIEYNKAMLSKELKRASLYNVILSEELRPLFIHLYEKKFVNTIKSSYLKPLYGYSMHETADAVTALTVLSSKKTKVAILLQSDLGKRIIEKVVNVKLFENLHKKTKLVGILSVSPAPIIETPKLHHLCNNVEVLVPGVALGEDVPREGKSKESGVVYYGRISKEKGIFDLLKAWRIVEKKEDAMLYIAGRFEDYRTKVKFEKTIKKNDLKRVIHLGYLDRRMLFETVARFSILAYPSYRDSFPMTVLESVAMRLRVVAYDIPALRYIYSGCRNVTLVPPGDFKQLALNIIENLKKPFERDDATSKILNLYSSWERVALKEYKYLNGIFNALSLLPHRKCSAPNFLKEAISRGGI
jgi:glycosyltransferase involved in cell wall biosynthesis